LTLGPICSVVVTRAITQTDILDTIRNFRKRSALYKEVVHHYGKNKLINNETLTYLQPIVFYEALIIMLDIFFFRASIRAIDITEIK
jgi:hypothetical protein